MPARFRFLCLPLLATSLVACASQNPATQSPASGTGTGPDRIAMGCAAQGAAWTIGQTPDDALAEKARQNANASSVRVLHAGQPATMEYNGGRLNLHVATNGKIKGVNCG